MGCFDCLPLLTLLLGGFTFMALFPLFDLHYLCSLCSCNNVLYIRQIPEEEADEPAEEAPAADDVEMGGEDA